MSFRQEVDAMNSRFFESFGKRDAAACASVFSEDCLWLLQGTGLIRGRADVKKSYADTIAGGMKLKSLEALHAEMDGKFGYAISKYDSSDGAGVVLTVVKRDSKGALTICAEAIIAAP